MLRVLEAMLELLGIFETGNVGEKTVGGGVLDCKSSRSSINIEFCLGGVNDIRKARNYF